VKFTDIIARITGFSTPVFGMSWEPPEFERDIIRKFLVSLEDRRVLYNPVHLVEFQEIKKSLLGQLFVACGTVLPTPKIARIIPLIFSDTSIADTVSITGTVEKVLENQKEVIIRRQIEIFDSIQTIRESISDLLQNLPENSKAISPLRSMRAACRKFLNNDPYSAGHEIAVALGELRSTFGVHLAILAVQYGIDIDSELSSIIPQEDND
jgi:hypothetical protein